MVYTRYIGMLLSGRRLKDSGCTTLTSWTPTTESMHGYAMYSLNLKDSWLIFIILYHCETYIMQYVHYTENIISAHNCKTDMTIINQWIILKCAWHSLIWLYILATGYTVCSFDSLFTYQSESIESYIIVAMHMHVVSFPWKTCSHASCVWHWKTRSRFAWEAGHHALERIPCSIYS